MKIECHIIQNFPPNCLNRDDTNSPKDCEFGGVRRARISSQCLKRAVRDDFDVAQAFSKEQRAVRTKRIVEQIAGLLSARGRDPEQATAAINTLLTGAKLKTETKAEGEAPKTQYLLFLPERKIVQLADLVDAHWDVLGAIVPAADESEEGKKPKKAKKKSADAAIVPKEARDAAIQLFKDARQSPEIALFGRMIADNPDWNVEAACQVAHAISTHRVSMEFDFYTAVDDLRGDTETGSDMMGTVQFNASCFYRYAVLDSEDLQENLGGADEAQLSISAIKAFLSSFVTARPTGKQNSMAAHTPPAVVLFTIRDKGQPVSLANAFAKPVTVTSNSPDLIQNSAHQLIVHLDELTRMYPSGLLAAHACSLVPQEWPKRVGVTEHESMDETIEAVCALLVNKAHAA